MTRLLFLDIDGVLNQCGERYSEEDWPFRMVERSCLAELDRVLAETGADIVLSSTWRLADVGAAIRKGHHRKTWGVTWQPIAFTGHFHGRQDGKYVGQLKRPVEIAAFLHATPNVESYAAVDDDGMGDYGIRGVWTHPYVGLTTEKADALIELLTTPCEPRVTDPRVLDALERWKR